MPAYSKTNWVDGSVPAIDATNLNKIEQGIYDSLRQDGSTTMSGQLVTTAGSAATPAIAPTGDSNTGIFFPAADTISFSKNGAEYLRFSGNLEEFYSTTTGAGTVAETQFRMDVGGGNANSKVAKIQALAYSPANQNSLAFFVGDWNNNNNIGTEKMRITSAGNVGIGTTSPTEKLQVNATSGNTGLNINTADSGAVSYISLSNTGASGKRYSLNVGGNTIGSGLTNNLFLYDNDNAAVRFLINPNGNVGIGTTSPSDYSGRASVGVNGTDGGIFECMVGGTVKFQIYPESSVITDSIVLNAAGANGYMRFQTYNSEKMRLNNNGYLLIGYTTSNGAYPLQVNGQIFATSSTIATSDGRYKKDVVSLDGALDIVKALNPVQFSWKEHPVHKFNTDVPTVGFIAQEVEQALADKSYLTSIIKKSECTWETETGETIEREVTRDVEKQVTREVEREITETIDGEEVTRTITEEVTETIIEQVTEIVTEPVKETHTEEFLGIAESNLIAILTKAVKELAAEVEALKAQLNK